MANLLLKDAKRETNDRILCYSLTFDDLHLKRLDINCLPVSLNLATHLTLKHDLCCLYWLYLLHQTLFTLMVFPDLSQSL